jgi:hypothetical protein
MSCSESLSPQQHGCHLNTQLQLLSASPEHPFQYYWKSRPETLQQCHPGGLHNQRVHPQGV